MMNPAGFPHFNGQFCTIYVGVVTEDCKLVVTCKMQNRNATDKLNQQCSKLALFANPINSANLLHCGFSFSVAFLFCILQGTTNLQSSVGMWPHGMAACYSSHV